MRYAQHDMWWSSTPMRKRSGLQSRSGVKIAIALCPKYGSPCCIRLDVSCRTPVVLRLWLRVERQLGITLVLPELRCPSMNVVSQFDLGTSDASSSL